MWTIPYLVSVLCMQLLADDEKSLLVAESDSRPEIVLNFSTPAGRSETLVAPTLYL